MSVVAGDYDIVLVLSGGNALGAFHAGVYQALHEHDLLPDWIVGASIGAINAALIAGTDPARRIDTLRAFWQADPFGVAWMPPALEIARRTNAVAMTIAGGRPGIFGPVLSALTPWSDNKPSIFETEQLEATLRQSVDFDRLNAGPCRFAATAVDLGTGEDVVFDSKAMRIDARHVRASAALPVMFPPVELDGRWFVDGGLSANLPLDPVLAAPPPRPTLCIAVDLLPLCQPLPQTIGEAASRAQDLIFAAQSRRSIARWQAAYAGREDVSVALLRCAYTDQADEIAGKAFDFSGPTIERRWASGHRAGLAMIERLGSLAIGAPGLTAYDDHAT